MTSRAFTVRGTVQGVSFRKHTKRMAEGLGLAGRAWNNADGSVSVIACGEAGALARLEEWLHRGPEQAKVTSVEPIEYAQESYDDFLVIACPDD